MLDSSPSTGRASDDRPRRFFKKSDGVYEAASPSRRRMYSTALRHSSYTFGCGVYSDFREFSVVVLAQP